MPLAVAVRYGGTMTDAFQATVDYLVIYIVTNIAAFAAVVAIARRNNGTSYADARGLFHSAPVLSTVFAVSLFSLAGMPPFGGWFAKLVVLKSAIDANSDMATALVVIAAINTAIGLVYYASVVRQLWLPAVGERAVSKLPIPLTAALVLMTIGIGVTGVVPGVVTHVGDWVAFTG
jgi:NADH-quinone oxidoreductase subunit N